MVHSHLQLFRGNYYVTFLLSKRFTVLGICNHILSRNAQYKGINAKMLRSADTLIKVTALTETYAGMHFMHQIKFTMYNNKLYSLRMGSAPIFLDFNSDSVHI